MSANENKQNTFRSWLGKLVGRKPTTIRRNGRGRPLTFELLEARENPSGFAVTGVETTLQAVATDFRAAYVASDGNHGFWLAGPDQFTFERSAVVAAHVNSGVVNLGQTIWLQPLSTVYPEAFLHDLQPAAGGTVVAVGQTTTDLGHGQAAMWQVVGNTGPVTPFVDPPDSAGSTIFFGDTTFHFTGGVNADAVINDGPGGMLLVRLPHPVGALTLGTDRYADPDAGIDIVIGQSDAKPIVWRKDFATGNWSYNTNLELPNWSDGSALLYRVGRQFIVGTIYDTRDGIAKTALWNHDGTLFKTFDSLPGYLPGELATVLNTDVLLMNNEEDPAAPSLIYTQDWAAPHTPDEYFGAGPAGTVLKIIDIGPGSLDMLGERTNLSTGVTTTVVGALSVSVDPPADTTPPTITGFVRAAADHTNAATVAFTVDFSEDVTGVDSQSVRITGLANASYTVTGSGHHFTITAGVPKGFVGNVGAELLTGNIKDLAGNLLQVGGTAPSYDVDRKDPIVVGLGPIGQDTTNAWDVQWALDLSEPVTGATKDMVQLVTTGNIGATVTSFTGSGSHYVFTVHTTGSQGTVIPKIVDRNVVLDGYNNLLGGDLLGDGNFTGKGVTIDRVAPTVQVFVNGGAQQRSIVDTILVRGNETLLFGSGLTNSNVGQFFTLTRVGTNTHIGLVVRSVSTAGGVTSVTLGFAPGFSVYAGGLFDGNYRFTVSTAVTDPVGNHLTTTVTTPVFALFGDRNGDGKVDLNEEKAAQRAYRSHVGQANYIPELDRDHNGVIGALERWTVKLNYTLSVRSHGQPLVYYSYIYPWWPWWMCHTHWCH